MKNYIHLPLTVALAITVSACDTTDHSNEKKPSQRDVYASLEDCVADWGDIELCQQEMKESREHQEKMAAARASGSSGGSTFVPIFMGPTYYGDSRSVVSPSGNTVSPATNRATRTANYTPMATGGRSLSYSAPKTPTPGVSPSSVMSRGPAGTVTSTATSTAARGGFGATGASASSGG